MTCTCKLQPLTAKPPAKYTEGCAIIRLFEDLGDKATTFSRHARPVARNLATLSPSEGPSFPSQILSRPVRRETRAARRCMAVTADLGANELRWPTPSRNPQPDRMSVLLLPVSAGAVRLGPARVSPPAPHSRQASFGSSKSLPHFSLSTTSGEDDFAAVA